MKAINPGFTVKLSTAFVIGCLIDNLHSSGNEPIFIKYKSIMVIMKKTINDGIISVSYTHLTLPTIYSV